MGFMSDLMVHKWIFIGSATCVFVAVMLEKTIDPTVAWFLGGSIMGGIMAIFEPRRKSSLKRIAIVPAAGLAAAMAHYAVTRLI